MVAGSFEAFMVETLSFCFVLRETAVFGIKCFFGYSFDAFAAFSQVSSSLSTFVIQKFVRFINLINYYYFVTTFAYQVIIKIVAFFRFFVNFLKLKKK